MSTSITASTDLFCVLGNPVAHSKSPLVHNQAFADHHIDAVFLAFEPFDIQQAMDAVREFDIRGVSITIPFKQTVMPFLDQIDDQALAIGAVNTIVNRNGKLCGYNTDSRAAVAPLNNSDISGKSVLVIGAGGAARAVSFGIYGQKGDLKITNRSQDKGRELAARYDAEFVPMAQVGQLRPDIVINATSVGMAPRENALSCPAECLTPGTLVMDVVYTPLETKLLSVARQKRCRVVDGLTMFVAQAAAQFEIWTGIHPDMEKMRQAVLAHRSSPGNVTNTRNR